MLAGFGLGGLHGALLQADAEVVRGRMLLPPRQRLAQGGDGDGQVRGQVGRWQAGGVVQLAALHVQRGLRGQVLRLQLGLLGAGFVDGGDGGGPQVKALLCFGQGAVDGGQLLLQHAQGFLCHGQVQVLLGGAQHGRLPGRLPLQVTDVGAGVQLLLLGAAFGVVQGLAGLQCNLGGVAVGDRGAKVHPIVGAHAGRGKLRPLHLRFAIAAPDAGAQPQAGPPQRLGLLAQGLGAAVGGLGGQPLGVVALCGLPGVQQIGGLGRQGGQQGAGGSGQGNSQWVRFYKKSVFSPCG